MSETIPGTAAVMACPHCGALPSCEAQGLVNWVYFCVPCGLTGEPSTDIAHAQGSWDTMATHAARALPPADATPPVVWEQAPPAEEPA